MNLVAPKPKPVATPPAAAPVPVADDEAMRDARKKQSVANQKRSGRMSTIISDSDKLG